MNCQEALSLLYEIIDKEASEIDAREVQKHLERCQNCFQVYRLESAIQEFINEKLKDTNPSPSLDTLRSKVLTKIDEVDREQALGESPSFFRRTAAVLAAAAALVILIGAAFWARGFYRHETEYTPLEHAHQAVTTYLSSIDDDKRTSSTVLSVRNRFGYELSPAVAGFALVGGQSEKIMGITMAHFVYFQENKVVSVFIAPSDQFDIPDDLKDTKVERHHISFFNHRCRNCRLTYHKAGPVIVITATTDRDVDLLDFVPGHTAT